MAETKGVSVEGKAPGSGGPTCASWRDAGVADHFVQFYRDDETLVEAVAGFMATGLRAVEGCIIIATEAHRKAIACRLEARGIDLGSVIARKQYISLDAEATLATFMVDGMPDEKLFQRTVGHVVTQMLSTGFRVRAFGEMVALLCAQNNAPAALRLEHLWNELAKTRRFSLFCAYPTSQFPDGSGDPVFQHVCATHSRVIPSP